MARKDSLTRCREGVENLGHGNAMAGKSLSHPVAQLTEARVFRDEDEPTGELEHAHRRTRFERTSIAVLFGHGDLAFLSEPHCRQRRHRQRGVRTRGQEVLLAMAG